MKQLTMIDILTLVNKFKRAGMTTSEINNLPIYIGNDDELNGIHTAWYGQMIDSNNANDADFVNMINEDFININIEGKAILIS